MTNIAQPNQKLYNPADLQSVLVQKFALEECLMQIFHTL